MGIKDEIDKLPEEDPGLKLPVTGADKCPHCGCTERIGRQYIDSLVANGRLLKGSYPKGLVMQIPIQGVSLGILVKPELPVLNIYYDVCKKCFTMYCTGADEILVPLQPMQQQPNWPPPGRFP